MCKGNCGNCKKAEFETTDVQVESLGQRSGMIVDDGWISVDDQKPGVFGQYLCFCNDIVNSWQEVLKFDGYSWVQFYDEEEFPCIVTHWRPLPPPPVK